MTPAEVNLKKEFRNVLRKAVEFLATRDAAARARLLRRWTPRECELVDLYVREDAFEVLRRLLEDVGRLYRTTEGVLMFFREGDHTLYDLEEKAFERLLIQFTGDVTRVKRLWLPRFQAWVRFDALEVTTHFLAYNDSADLNVIALNCFDGRMMRRRRGGTWERVPNGTDGVLFWTPMEVLTPWQPDFTEKGTGADLEWLCALAPFDGDGPLSVDDQQRLLYVWMVHLFVPALNPVRPIPNHEGITGSGKTSLGECLGRSLTGPEFEVMDLPAGDSAKAEESLKLALYKRPLVVIDNVDSPSRWLEDFLARVATWVRMSRRKLYTDAEEVHFTPRAGLIITSRDPHFRREDVARRLLPLRFQGIREEQRRTETELRAEVDARRMGILTDILTILGRIQDTWPQLQGKLRSSHSLADFSIFGELVERARPEHGRPDGWRELMGRLERAQRRFTTEEDPLVEVLQILLPHCHGVIPYQPLSELFCTLQETAGNFRLSWPFRSLGPLTKHLKSRRQALQQTLNARIVLDNHHQGSEYWVAITSVTEEEPSHSADRRQDGMASIHQTQEDAEAISQGAPVGGQGGEGGDELPNSLLQDEGLIL